MVGGKQPEPRAGCLGDQQPIERLMPGELGEVAEFLALRARNTRSTAIAVLALTNPRLESPESGDGPSPACSRNWAEGCKTKQSRQETEHDEAKKAKSTPRPGRHGDSRHGRAAGGGCARGRGPDRGGRRTP